MPLFKKLHFKVRFKKLHFKIRRRYLKFVKKRNRFFLVDKRYKLLTVKQSYTSKPIWFTFFVKNLRRRKRFIKRLKNSFKRLRIN